MNFWELEFTPPRLVVALGSVWKVLRLAWLRVGDVAVLSPSPLSAVPSAVSPGDQEALLWQGQLQGPPPPKPCGLALPGQQTP